MQSRTKADASASCQPQLALVLARSSSVVVPKVKPTTICIEVRTGNVKASPKTGDLFSAPFASPSRTPSGSPTVTTWSPLSRKCQKQRYILCSHKDG
jgi:hypothetical protein